MTSHTLGQIAARFALKLRGDAATPIDGVATLAAAGARELGFLANPRYRTQLATTAAGAIVLGAADADAFARAVLIADDPYVAFARIATLYERKPAAAPGVHASAVVGEGARIAASASIGPHTRPELVSWASRARARTAPVGSGWWARRSRSTPRTPLPVRVRAAAATDTGPVNGRGAGAMVAEHLTSEACSPGGAFVLETACRPVAGYLAGPFWAQRRHLYA